jgi:hypothetical protein
MPVPPPLSTAQQPQPELPSSSAPPVFVDLGGRRARLMRALGVGLALLCGAYLLLVTLSLLGVPIAPLPVPLPGEPRPAHPHRAVRGPEPLLPPATVNRAEGAPSADNESAAVPTLIAQARDAVHQRATAAAASTTPAQMADTEAPALGLSISAQTLPVRSAVAGHVVLTNRSPAPTSRAPGTWQGSSGNRTTGGGSGSASGPAADVPVRGRQPTVAVRRPVPAAKAVPPGLVRAAAVRIQHAAQHVTKPAREHPARPDAASVRAQGAGTNGRARATRGR